MAITEKGIYYPNDGTKVADILTDMKKMAESIDKTIEENEFDPSQLNQSIINLQQNVTNLQESQTAQDNEIDQIKGTLANKKTEIAKSIHIEDAEGFGKLSILGNHEQNEEPSEENPVEIKCLGDNKKNLFSLDNKLENVKVNRHYEIENDDEYTSYYAELEVGEDYVITCKRDPIYASYTRIYWACFDEIPATGKGKGYTFYDKDMNNQKINAKKKYFVISFIKEIVDEKWIYDIQLEKGTVATPFVPYEQGSTEIKVENSDKTQDLTYVLPIQQEMLKGDVFSKELDAWKEVHNWQKIDSYNGENITTDYISTTGSLTTGATVFYKLQTPIKIPCTEEQSKILNQLNALDLFEDVNDITTTENIALLQLKYVSNVNEVDILKEEIEDLKDNQIHIATEQSSTINVQDASGQNAKINVFGNSIQNGEPTPKAPVNIENVVGDIDITIENEDKSQSQIITFPLQENQKFCEKDYLANNGIHHVLQFLELQGTEIFAEYSPTIYNPLNICAFRLQQTLPKNADTSLALSTHFSLKDLAQNNINPEANKFSYYTDEGRSDNGLYFFLNYKDIGVQSTDTSEQKIEKFKNWLVQQKTNNTSVIVGYGLSKENEEIETYTEAQQEAYDQLQNVTPYKLVTNISTDKAKLQFNYIADTKTYIDNKVTNTQKQLNTINELLSTANTSAMLLDNLQTDLESEVL